MHTLLFIAVMAAVTFAVRLAPFLLFDRGQTPPHWVEVLGSQLPPACMSVLVVYCLRGVDITCGSHGIPELLCVALAMALHAWKRNTLLSIGCSTLLYMVLVQAVF